MRSVDARGAFAALAVAALASSGCGSDSLIKGLVSLDGSVLGDDGPAGDSQTLVPPRPELGALIDRAGRPGVNAMLVDVFDFDRQRDRLADQYNQDADAAGWRSRYAPLLAGDLAILDILDGLCGNQLLYDKRAGGIGLEGYSRLADALADDRLYVDSRSGQCSSYLAVEQAALAGGAAGDCGGRAPGYDVVDETYALVAGPAQPVSDGVAADTAGRVVAAFPFFGSPNL